MYNRLKAHSFSFFVILSLLLIVVGIPAISVKADTTITFSGEELLARPTASSTAEVNYSYTIHPESSATTHDLIVAVDPVGAGTTDPADGLHTYVANEAVTDSATAETIAYLGSLGTAVSKTSDTSLVVTTTAAVTTGDDIIVAVATDPNSSLVVSVADPAGNSYSQVGYVVNSGNIRTYLYAAYDVNSFPSGSSITVNSSPAVTARTAVVALFRGLADSSPLDQTKSGTGSNTVPSSGATSTTNQADELLVGAVGTEGPDGDTAGTWDGSFTAGPRLGTTGGTADSNITASLGYRIVSSTGAYSASKSNITSRDWAAMIACFKAGPGGVHPAIITTGTPLSAFSGVPASPSAEQTYTVSGSGLLDTITITAPADIQISLSSGSGFASSLVLSPSGGSVTDTPIYVRFNRATEGTSSGYLAHTSSGATTRNIAVSGTAAPLSPVSFNILLGRPTNVSVTANIIQDQDVEFYIEYGTSSGTYTAQTATFTGTANQPVELVIGSLSANTRFYYHIVYRRTGTTDWNLGTEHSFITQRSPGSTFTFTVTSDSHLGQYGGQTTDELALYQQTLLNVAADHPDFHIDTGDTFPMDPSPLGTGMTDAEAKAAYLYQRPYLGAMTDSIPYFQVLGNHENEEGWNFDDVFPAPDQSLAIVGMKYRKLYYPNPVPDSFYSGNTDTSYGVIGGDALQEDYYAWTWGDALFVVIDPYHYSKVWPSEGGTYGGEGQDGEVGGTRWDWSLGIQQYLWLKSTIENSNATYKFVFAHQVTGGSTAYGRGGIDAAPYFEWGGKNADGTWGFDVHRPASEGWTLPIHQLMVANGVDIFFHGHDHIYSFEQLDGITYVECAKPDDAGYAWDPYGYGYTEGLYPNGVNIQNSGYLRVSVSPAETKVEYVRSYLPGDGTNGVVAHSFTISGTAPTTFALNVSKSGTGSGTITSFPAGIDCGSTCLANFNSAVIVALSAVADAGSTFSGWSGACTGSGTCQVTMDAIKAVTANFSQIMYTLTAGNDGHGTATLSPSGGTYASGTSVILIPVANTGYQFSVWSGANGGEIINSALGYTIVMDGNKTVHANFTLATYSLTVSRSGTGSGSVTSAPAGIDCGSSCSANFDYNNSVTLMATATTGSTFTRWSGSCIGSVHTCTILMDATKTVTAIFTLNTDHTHTISLVSGWNLVSFNIHPASTAIADVLVSLGTNYDLVYAWNASTSLWMKYDPSVGYGNTLTSLDETMGFWIKMNSGGTLMVSGSEPGTTNNALKTGWNLVGFPSTATLALPDVFSLHGVSTDFTLVYAYHGNDTGDLWKIYDLMGPVYSNDLTVLAPDWGYWVLVGGNHTWDVSY